MSAEERSNLYFRKKIEIYSMPRDSVEKEEKKGEFKSINCIFEALNRFRFFCQWATLGPSPKSFFKSVYFELLCQKVLVVPELEMSWADILRFSPSYKSSYLKRRGKKDATGMGSQSFNARFLRELRLRRILPPNEWLPQSFYPDHFWPKMFILV